MAERIASPLKTKEIIEKNEFYFKKHFGQNFLIDSNILYKIITSANINENDCVMEIGPGIGSLTQVLAENANKVIAVEIDEKLIPILKKTLIEYENIEIINSDVLKLDINDIIENKNSGNPIKVVANLPYYITTPIIMELLEGDYNVETITVMVQKEVAQRMQAKPSSKDYGALSVAVQFYSEPVLNTIVTPGCFIPKPNVDSAVITLNILKNGKIHVNDSDLMFKIVKCAFGQRRKTLLNSIYNQSGFNISKPQLTEILSKLGLNEKVRGENLSVEMFARLSDELGEYLNTEKFEGE